MEGIKETDLNLQREVVTTLANTWLVEAVNPSTGEKKMINIANYASVVAGVFKHYFVGGEDLNNCTSEGSYLSGGKTISNIPVQVTYFTVYVLAYNNSNVLQIFVHNNGDIYIRSNYAGTWYDWKKIA